MWRLLLISVLFGSDLEHNLKHKVLNLNESNYGLENLTSEVWLSFASFIAQILYFLVMNWLNLFGCLNIRWLIELVCFFWSFRITNSTSCPTMTTSQRTMSLLLGWKMRRMSFFLACHRNLPVKCSKILSRPGTNKNLTPDTMKASWVDPGVLIIGKSGPEYIQQQKQLFFPSCVKVFASLLVELAVYLGLPRLCSTHVYTFFLLW